MTTLDELKTNIKKQVNAVNRAIDEMGFTREQRIHARIWKIYLDDLTLISYGMDLLDPKTHDETAATIKAKIMASYDEAQHG